MNLGQNGWVLSLPDSGNSSLEYDSAATLLYREIDGRYPGGQYVVFYDGVGEIEYDFDATQDVSASTLGKDIIDVNPSDGGILLAISETDPDDPIRNIRVVPFDPDQPDLEYEDIIGQNASNTIGENFFNPDFIEKLDDFSVLRFMDWMQTNNSTQSEWSDRPTLENATWSLTGTPVEIMVELANQTNTDPWFTMPHMATDQYVQNFAEYVRDNLDPDLDIYIEYSNETWNTTFEQAEYVQNQGRLEWSDSIESDLTLGRDWFGKRTAEITQIWDDVFATDNDRIIGVLGAQAAWTFTAERPLEYIESTGLTLEEAGIDTIAIAPYFGNYLGNPNNESEVESWTEETDGGLDSLFQELTEGGVLTAKEGTPEDGALTLAYRNIEDYVDLAEEEGLDLIAYEGGQHLVGLGEVENNEDITNLFIAANRDPRMGELYEEYLETWNNLGGGLFVHYYDVQQSSKSGSWGALEYLDQDSSPKYDALIDYANSSGDI